MPTKGSGFHHVDLAVSDVEHLAIEVDRPDEVDDAYARCLSSGARIHFPPKEDRDEPGYYAFFVFDPDGFRIEVFSWEQGE